MRALHTTSILLLLPFFLHAQSFNALTPTKTFSSETGLLKAYPQFAKRKITIDKSHINVLRDDIVLQKQIPRNNVPPNLNSILFSPLGDYFVAFEETEVQSDYLYFYDPHGVLLAKQRVDVYPVVRYSNDGEYVTVYDSFGSEVFIFNKFGKLLFNTDYIELTKVHNEVLYGVFVSEDATLVILNVGEELYLCSVKSKQKIYSVTSGWILDASFYSNKGRVVMRTTTNKNGINDLKVFSIPDGELLDQISQVTRVEFTPAGAVVFKNNVIQEYLVK